MHHMRGTKWWISSDLRIETLIVVCIMWVGQSGGFSDFKILEIILHDNGG